MAGKHAIAEYKIQVIQKKITKSEEIIQYCFHLISSSKAISVPDYKYSITLASKFNTYFIDKIVNIRLEFPLLDSSLPSYSFESMESILPSSTYLPESFTIITSEELTKIVSVMN